MSFLAYWKSLLTTRRHKKFSKSPQPGTDQTTILKKCKITQSVIFMEKAHSLGQTYVCLSLIKPGLGTDIGTCVPAWPIRPWYFQASTVSPILKWSLHTDSVLVNYLCITTESHGYTSANEIAKVCCRFQGCEANILLESGVGVHLHLVKSYCWIWYIFSQG